MDAEQCEEEVHVCPYCEKEFSSRSQAMEHMLLHTGDKPHICGICNKGFSRKSTLQSHKMLKHKNQLHSCDTCDKVLPLNKKTKSQVDKNALFTCDICNKSYCHKLYLEEHQKSHGMEISYVCNVCNKEFTSRQNVYQHSLIHKKKPYLCKICNKSFVVKHKLELHILSHANTKTSNEPSAEDLETREVDDPPKEELQENRDAEEKHKVNETDEAQSKPETLYPCKDCNRTFKHVRFLKSHVRIVHCAENPYVCKLCNRKFRLKEHLRLHAVVHT